MSVTPHDDLNRSNSNIGSQVKTNAPSLDALVGLYEAKGWRVSGINQESVSLTRESIKSKTDISSHPLDTQVEIAKFVEFGRIFRRIIYCVTFLAFSTLLLITYIAEPDHNTTPISWSAVITALVAPCGVAIAVLQVCTQVWKRDRFRIMQLESVLGTQNSEVVKEISKLEFVLINREQVNFDSIATHLPTIYCVTLLIFAAMVIGNVIFAHFASLGTPLIAIALALVAPAGLLTVTFRLFSDIWILNRKRIRQLETILDVDRNRTTSANEELNRIEGATGMPSETDSTFGQSSRNDSTDESGKFHLKQRD